VEEDESLPEPPVALHHTAFLANARLVLIKLRQQLEEVTVGAVRQMEEASEQQSLPGGALPGARGSRHRPSAAGALSGTRSLLGAADREGLSLAGGYADPYSDGAGGLGLSMR
jgi:hypothetical protein